MRALASSQVIRIWERGERQDPAERALTLLEAAVPGKPRRRLARYSIGRRDSCLLDLRQRTFPGELNAFAECPRCAEPLEYSLNAAELRERAGGTGRPKPVEADGLTLELRLPDGIDFAHAARASSVDEARQRLARCCISGAAVEELPEPVLAEVAAHLAEADPGADLLIDLECPACAERWQVVFDIASYLWEELRVLARRLMAEVHELARAYAWSERDILAMSPARRRFYLEMVS
jgi:hypothetical protein